MGHRFNDVGEPEQEKLFEIQRAILLQEIANDARSTAAYTGRNTFSARVMDAMRRVPRHAFVPPSASAQAYCNRPVPIGFGQTISQPYIVALMTDLLDCDSQDVVLEVGTGCGYQAAVLAEIVRRVYTLERVPELAESAARRLGRLGVDNVQVIAADGYFGFPAHAPTTGLL